MSAPFAPGSVSLRLYPHNDLAAPGIVDELRAQAALGGRARLRRRDDERAPRRLPRLPPNPLQAAGWCLEAMATAGPRRARCCSRCARPRWSRRRSRGWRRASPAASASASRRARSPTTSRSCTCRWTASRRASPPGSRSSRACSTAASPARSPTIPPSPPLAEHPVPVLSAAMGFTAVRRAARLGAGLLFDSLSTPERCRELTDAYREAGGTAPCVMIRRAWVGEPPRQRLDDQIDVYRSYSPTSAQQHWGGNELVDSPTPEHVVAGLVDALDRVRGRRAEPPRPRPGRGTRGRPGADRPPRRRGPASAPERSGRSAPTNLTEASIAPGCIFEGARS